MQFSNKREELEYEASDHKLFNATHHTLEQNFIQKVNNSEISSVWPLIPLINFEKEAYKHDEVYLFNKQGDEPIDQNESQKLIKSIIIFAFFSI